jgi:hypothetical protein
MSNYKGIPICQAKRIPRRIALQFAFQLHFQPSVQVTSTDQENKVRTAKLQPVFVLRQLLPLTLMKDTRRGSIR